MRRSEQAVLLQNAERLDSEIIYNRDFDYDYFGFKVRFNLKTAWQSTPCRWAVHCGLHSDAFISTHLRCVAGLLSGMLVRNACLHSGAEQHASWLAVP